MPLGIFDAGVVGGGSLRLWVVALGLRPFLGVVVICFERA